MYSDNEKDFVENTDNSQDDVISWGDIIDTDDDGIISIKGNKGDVNSSPEITTEVFSNSANSSEDELIKDIVSDVDIDLDSSSGVNDIDEDELKRILNDDSVSEYNGSDDTQSIDIDTSYSAPKEEDIVLPRKEEVKKQSSIMPFLIALLFGLLVAGGIYYFVSMRSEQAEDIPSVINPEQAAMQNEDSVPSEEASPESIPVVNEDEVSELKAEEEKKEEKKEVVNVIPTGRINPFVPIGKYIPPKVETKTNVNVVTKTINNIDYSSVSIPKPPAEYGKISEITDKLMSITVSGIMYDKIRPSAIITFEDNDYFVLIGDRLNNFKIVDISPTYVKIAYKNNIYKANVGEEFKINEVNGSADYMKDGIRQYSTPDSDYRGREKEKKQLIDRDVEIYTR